VSTSTGAVTDSSGASQRRGRDALGKVDDRTEEDDMAAYECPECGAHFTERQQFERHRERDHRGSGEGEDPVEDHLHTDARLGGPQGIDLGPEEGSTRQRQMRGGLGSAEMGAVDERIDFGTTLDTAAEAEGVERRRGEERHAVYRCERCDATFDTPGDLQRHYEQEHGELKRVS
jgi:uncharacterized C2H2 Zn-finger protein